MSEANYYSMRRLSPYQGAIQVAAIPGFRAMSPDGVTWQVQIMSQHSRFSSYGVWRADGTGNLIETHHTRDIIDVLRDHPPLPFPLADKLELWLLDGEVGHLPLAILVSTLPHLSPPKNAEAVWQPTLAGDDSFVSPSLQALDEDGDPHTEPVSHCEMLGRFIRETAGPQAKAQWFRRDAEGNGTGFSGCHIDGALEHRELGQADFPELLLREKWDRKEDADLVRDYHDWQAANLLTHNNLSHATRDRLEHAACKQAQKLYKVRHLLPKVINPDLIKVAMVEAVIRRSAHA